MLNGEPRIKDYSLDGAMSKRSPELKLKVKEEQVIDDARIAVAVEQIARLLLETWEKRKGQEHDKNRY